MMINTQQPTKHKECFCGKNPSDHNGHSKTTMKTRASRPRTSTGDERGFRPDLKKDDESLKEYVEDEHLEEDGPNFGALMQFSCFEGYY